MSAANTTATYGSVAKTLHWATALLILTLVPLGFIAVAWPYDTSDSLATKALLFSIHKTLGVGVFFIALARIAWALSQPRPVPLHPQRRLETALAEGVHWALYVALVAVPLTGWVHHAATTGFAPIWWPLGQTLPFVPQSTALAEATASLHRAFVFLLLATLALHVAGALKHHLVDRDGTLARMWPGRRAPVPAATAEPARRHAPAPAAAAFGIYALVGAVALLTAPGAEPRSVAATAIAAESGATLEGAARWRVESGSLGFTVRSLGNPVTGRFAEWSAQIAFDEEADADGRHGAVEVLILVESMSLGSVTAQARGPEFFAVETHPTARFGAEIVAAEGGGYEARGTLDLVGASVPVSLPFTLEIDGDTARAAGTVTVDRRAFGMGQSYPDEATVGFAVEIAFEIEARREDGAPGAGPRS